jgi:hypothetical protein
MKKNEKKFSTKYLVTILLAFSCSGYAYSQISLIHLNDRDAAGIALTQSSPGDTALGTEGQRNDMDKDDGLYASVEMDAVDTVAINAGMNDAWYNLETDGQGFFITVFPDLDAVSLAWFTYDTELPAEDATANLGDPSHRWLTAVGPIEGNKAVMEIEMTSGGLFDTSTLIDRTDPPGSDGTIILTFTSCNAGTVEYNIPSINRQGTVNIQRVANDNIALCEAINLATTVCLLKPPIKDGFKEPNPNRTISYDKPTSVVGLAPLGENALGQDYASEVSATADFNGDGLLDLIAHLSAVQLNEAGPSEPIQILLNVGDGTLVDCTDELIAGATPHMQFTRDIIIEDFNGDSKPDVFFSNTGHEDVDPFVCEQNRLLLSGDDGKFHDVTSTHLPQVVDFSHGSSAADVDNDGDVDIYVPNLGCASEQGPYLLKNDGNGVFEMVVENNIVAWPNWSDFVDVDNDGDSDLFVSIRKRVGDSEPYDHSFESLVYINDGVGNFTKDNMLVLPPPTHQCVDDESKKTAGDSAVADINQDGWMDIIPFYSTCVYPHFQILVNNHDGTFTDETNQRIPAYETEQFGGHPTFHVRDFNGDQFADIFYNTYKSDGTSRVAFFFLNNGEGGFTRLEVGSGLDLFGPEMTVIDLNGDGILDLLHQYSTGWEPDWTPPAVMKWYKKLGKFTD